MSLNTSPRRPLLSIVLVAVAFALVNVPGVAS
jgi:hypothetical protein